MLDKLAAYLPTIAKALAAAVAAPILAWFVKHGLVLDPDQQETLLTILAGLVTGFVVWIVPNSKAKK